MTDSETLPPPVRDEEGALAPGFITDIRAAIAVSDADRLKELTQDLHEADLGDLLGALPDDEQAELVRLLGTDFDFTALTELDETVRVRLVEAMAPEAVARGVRTLDSDDAVYILEDLEPAEKDAILDQLPYHERARLIRALDYPEESAGRRMQTEFIAVPPFWTVGQTLDYLREEAASLPETFYEVHVVDPGFRLVGFVPLDKLLRAPRPTRIEEVCDEAHHTIHATDDQEDVARMFRRYNLISAAVVDEAGRMVGVITIDDVVDVIEEEAEEDILAISGVVGDEELSDTVLYTARSRFPWLLVNMGTAFLSASMIALFDGTIAKMVALAVLMPIVASMGGNAGTQAMVVTVRAIATRTINRRNLARLIGREVLVGAVNGLSFALIVGVVAGLWFRDPQLGGVIATAMLANLVIAGLAGATLPLVLDKVGADPAVASGVFLTTVTDVVGFVAFLGLATWWFGLG